MATTKVDYEAKRAKDVSAVAHESAWAESKAVRDELETLRQILCEYANILAEVANVPSLI